MKLTKEISECVGLWLAEGNNKCRDEITFTNNCYDLILYFDDCLNSIFDTSNKRLYIYSADGQTINSATPSFLIVKHYTDNRANIPYFIWRLASVKLMKVWREIVNETLSSPEFYRDILRGFFAGEGSVKVGAHSNRILRVAQKEEKPWLNNIFDRLGLSYTFEPTHRTYEFSGKWNWDVFAKHSIADLHPVKRKKFWKAYTDFKQVHYPHNLIYDNILKELVTPKQSSVLAKRFNRTQNHVSEILSRLKKEGKVTERRVGHTNYWSIT